MIVKLAVPIGRLGSDFQFNSNKLSASHFDSLMERKYLLRFKFFFSLGLVYQQKTFKSDQKIEICAVKHGKPSTFKIYLNLNSILSLNLSKFL